jgi:hypothetical protein
MAKAKEPNVNNGFDTSQNEAENLARYVSSDPY